MSETLEPTDAILPEMLGGLTIAAIRDGLASGRFTAEALAEAALAQVSRLAPGKCSNAAVCPRLRTH
ncbi:hypothetical protein [Mangrovicoccus ximenensis]|uniref:hypothetical protein n=1 Tax=Mangrovicoccus ximenensis TaxID=1911570 RepID=UPI000D3A5795|nr:hypothetical protein [Mangrovicoccus ximenensis]